MYSQLKVVQGSKQARGQNQILPNSDLKLSQIRALDIEDAMSAIAAQTWIPKYFQTFKSWEVQWYRWYPLFFKGIGAKEGEAWKSSQSEWLLSFGL